MTLLCPYKINYFAYTGYQLQFLCKVRSKCSLAKEAAARRLLPDRKPKIISGEDKTEVATCVVCRPKIPSFTNRKHPLQIINNNK